MVAQASCLCFSVFCCKEDCILLVDTAIKDNRLNPPYTYALPMLFFHILQICLSLLKGIDKCSGIDGIVVRVFLVILGPLF